MNLENILLIVFLVFDFAFFMSLGIYLIVQGNRANRRIERMIDEQCLMDLVKLHKGEPSWYRGDSE